MRIRGAKTEMEEAGLETEGMAESTAKLRAEMMALSGVDIMLNENTFKSTYQIMDELADKWEHLSDIQQASVIELIAGKRQGNIVSSLLENFDIAENVLETSVNSSGSAMREHEKYSESLEHRINVLKATWQSLAQSFMSSDFLKSALDGVISLVDGLDKLISTIGTLPTLFGTLAAGLSLYNGTGFFKVIEDEADASVKKIGTIFNNGKITQSFESIFSDSDSIFAKSLEVDKEALTAYLENLSESSVSEDVFSEIFENASIEAREFAESGRLATEGMEAFTEEQIQAEVATISQNHSLSNARNILREYNSGCQNTGLSQEQFINSVGQGNSIMAGYLNSLNGHNATMGGFIRYLATATLRTVALSAATAAFNAILSMGVSAAISLVISQLDKWIVTADELAEKVDEITAKYKEQRQEINKMKVDYDTSNEDSMISRYGELSKGVNALGENIALTADEYAEYQSIVETVASQIPGLVTGYNSQGEAILSCAGDVNALADAYKNLILEQNKAVIDEGASIFKDFTNDAYSYYREKGISTIRRNEVDTSGGQGLETMSATGHLETLDEILSKFNFDGEYENLTSWVEELSNTNADRIAEILEENGFDRNKLFTGEKGSETKKEFIARAIKEDSDAVKQALESSYNDINKYVEDLNIFSDAYLSTEFLTNYSHMSDRMQGIIGQVASSFDANFYDQFSSIDEIENYLDSMLSAFDGLDEDQKLDFEAAFDLKTQFNGGKISFGEYVNGIQDAASLIDGLGLDEEITSQIKLSLGLSEKDGTWVIEEYETLLNRLTSEKYEIQLSTEEAEKLLSELSSSEYSVLMDLVMSGEVDLSNFDINSLRAYIEEQARLNEAINFAIDMNIETSGIEAFNTSLSESRSAAGLTAESISALKDRYRDLDGYNAAALFEKTAGGIRLNNEELARLESQYENINKLDISRNLNTLIEEYNKLTDEINACTDAQEKESLQAQADSYRNKIEELQTLASQYDGLTSAFSKWQNAQSTANDGDNYDSVYDAIEGIQELYSKGLVGTDDFKTAVQLMNFEDLSTASIEEHISAYTKGIPKIQRYFTEGHNGCQNFLNDISKLNSEWAHLNEDGQWEIKFNAEDVAKELDLSVDSILLIASKLRDYGFEIDLDDGSIDSLQSKIEQTEARLKELGQSPHQVDLTIEASTENLGKIDDEIESIKSYISEVNNSSVEPDVKTAQLEDAQAKLESLIQKKIEASQPTFMSLDTSQVNASLVDALEKVQTYQSAVNNLNTLLELKEAGITVDDSEVDVAKQKIDECAKAIQGLDGDVKVSIGLEEDGSIESIKKSFEDGKVNIDANTDPVLTKVEQLAETVDRIEDKDIIIDVTVNGLEDVKELSKNIDIATKIDGDIDKLTDYVESAKALSELDDNISTFVTANIRGNVTETKGNKLERLKEFAGSAEQLKELKEVGSFTTDIDANIKAEIKGNITDVKESAIDNLSAFATHAKELQEANIGTDTVASISANVYGNITDKKENAIDNLSVFATHAQSLKDMDIGTGTVASVTANVYGNVTKKEDAALDNLSFFAEEIDEISDLNGTNVSVSATANVYGNVVKRKESAIDNIGMFAEEVNDISDLNGTNVNISVTANAYGNVVNKKEVALDNLSFFAEEIDEISDLNGTNVSASVTANVYGNVTKKEDAALDNLGAFVEGANELKNADIGSDTVASITANVYGNVINKEDGAIDNLGLFSDEAQKLKDKGIGEDTRASITANVYGNVVKREESAIDNLSKFADEASKLKDENIGSDTVASVTANIYGNVVDREESSIDNLSKFAAEAKELINAGIDDIDASVTANVYGNVINKDSDALNNLGEFADGVSDLQSTSDVTRTASAYAYGNVISGNDAANKLSSLTEFSSLVSGMTNQTVSVSVTASVDSENINQAIQILTNVANSGVFKDYSATVQVGAVIATIDDTVVKNYTVPDKEGTAIYNVDSSKVDAYKAPPKTGKITYSPIVKALTNAQKNKTGTITYKARIIGGPSPAAGTAHAAGTGDSNSASGRSFARGSWGIKGNGVALVGELGQELVVRDGRFFTIGDKGAEFFKYRKNDIVFNAAQTESLFKYGGIKGANPRGKMLATGTAYAEGNAFPGGNITGGGQFYGGASDLSSTTTSSNKTDSSSKKTEEAAEKTKEAAEEFKESIDLIEIAIDRLERTISQLDTRASSAYRSWEERNSALVEQIGKTREEIALQQKAYERYMQEAANVGLDASWIAKIQNGEIDIETITDEELAEKIKLYQEWYEKALACEDAIIELKEAEAELFKQRFDNVVTQYEGMLSIIEHEKNMLDEFVAQSEAQGHLVSEKYYQALISNEQKNIAKLQEEKAALLSKLQEGMESGAIEKNSEAWVEMVNKIDDVTLSIEESRTAILEYQQALQQLKWEQFDLLQDQISSVTQEAEFLIDLMSNKKLFDDNGQLTDEGQATMGMHGVAYNIHMNQADQYGAEAERLKAEMASDPYDQELEARYREVVGLQQESILAAEAEKDAIRDLVSDGIELELSALEEKINLYQEALDSQKD